MSDKQYVILEIAHGVQNEDGNRMLKMLKIINVNAVFLKIQSESMVKNSS